MPMRQAVSAPAICGKRPPTAIASIMAAYRGRGFSDVWVRIEHFPPLRDMAISLMQFMQRLGQGKQFYSLNALTSQLIVSKHEERHLGGLIWHQPCTSDIGNRSMGLVHARRNSTFLPAWPSPSALHFRGIGASRDGGAVGISMADYSADRDSQIVARVL